MNIANLIADLQARGVTLRRDGSALKVRPVSRLTPGELETLKEHKEEILAALTAAAAVYPMATLDPTTVREVFGTDPNPHVLACISWDVADAIRALKVEIRSGAIAPGVRMVQGRPLGDWLSLDDVARLLQLGASRGQDAIP